MFVITVVREVKTYTSLFQKYKRYTGIIILLIIFFERYKHLRKWLKNSRPCKNIKYCLREEKMNN